MIAVKITAGILTLLLCAAATASARAETYGQLLDKSRKAMMSEDWRAGLAHTRAMLDLPALSREQLAGGLAHLCIHLTQLDRAAEAQAACNESIARDALIDAVLLLTDTPVPETRVQRAEQILAEP
jgi:hypothetical protein